MKLLVDDHRGTESSSPATFGSLLRRWRKHRALSQLELSLDTGVSARHLSFLETGRSQPSREMVHVLLEALKIPLRERNRVLLAAGFAPAYSQSSLDDYQAAHVRKAVRCLLERHEPYPAYAIDNLWNVVDANQAFYAGLEETLDQNIPAPVNILRLVFAPGELRSSILNWKAVAGSMLRRVAKQLDAPKVPEELAEIVSEIYSYPGASELLEQPVDPSSFDLFIPVTVRSGETTLNWLTTLVSFAGAVDVTLEELVLECFFPADEITEHYFEQLEKAPSSN